MMSRSRFQGTEVTIVTGAFSFCIVLWIKVFAKPINVNEHCVAHCDLEKRS